MTVLEQAFEQASRNMLTSLVNMQILPRCENSSDPEFHKQIRDYLLAHETLLNLLKEYAYQNAQKNRTSLNSHLKK